MYSPASSTLDKDPVYIEINDKVRGTNQFSVLKELLDKNENEKIEVIEIISNSGQGKSELLLLAEKHIKSKVNKIAYSFMCPTTDQELIDVFQGFVNSETRDFNKRDLGMSDEKWVEYLKKNYLLHYKRNHGNKKTICLLIDEVSPEKKIYIEKIKDFVRREQGNLSLVLIIASKEQNFIGQSKKITLDESFTKNIIADHSKNSIIPPEFKNGPTLWIAIFLRWYELNSRWSEQYNIETIDNLIDQILSSKSTVFKEFMLQLTYLDTEIIHENIIIAFLPELQGEDIERMSGGLLQLVNNKNFTGYKLHMLVRDKIRSSLNRLIIPKISAETCLKECVEKISSAYPTFYDMSQEAFEKRKILFPYAKKIHKQIPDNSKNNLVHYQSRLDLNLALSEKDAGSADNALHIIQKLKANGSLSADAILLEAQILILKEEYVDAHDKLTKINLPISDIRGILIIFLSFFCQYSFDKRDAKELQSLLDKLAEVDMSSLSDLCKKIALSCKERMKGLICLEQGNLNDALIFFKNDESHFLAKNNYPEHYAYGLLNFAIVYRKLAESCKEDYITKINYLKKGTYYISLGIEFCCATFGKSHPITIRLLIECANLELTLSRPERAKTIFELCQEKRKKLYRDSNYTTDYLRRKIESCDQEINSELYSDNIIKLEKEDLNDKLHSVLAEELRVKIYRAVIVGDVANVEIHLNSYFDLNLTAKQFYSISVIFMLAAHYKQAGVMFLLINKFVSQLNINYQDPQGYTALHIACYVGHLDIADLLTQGGADSSIKNAKNKIAYEYAEECGFSDICFRLALTKTKFSNTILENVFLKIKNNDNEELLDEIKNGDYILNYRHEGLDPICFALIHDNEAAVQIIIKRLLASPNQYSKNSAKWYFSYLHRAVILGRLSVVHLLLTKEVENYFLIDDLKFTRVRSATWYPIHEAAASVSEYSKEIMRLLIMHDPEFIDAPEYNGDNALFIALIKGHMDIVRLLVSNGASPHQANNNGITPYQYAVLNKNDEALKIFKQAETIAHDKLMMSLQKNVGASDHDFHKHFTRVFNEYFNEEKMKLKHKNIIPFAVNSIHGKLSMLDILFSIAEKKNIQLCAESGAGKTTVLEGLALILKDNGYYPLLIKSDGENFWIYNDEKHKLTDPINLDNIKEFRDFPDKSRVVLLIDDIDKSISGSDFIKVETVHPNNPRLVQQNPDSYQFYQISDFEQTQIYSYITAYFYDSYFFVDVINYIDKTPGIYDVLRKPLMLRLFCDALKSKNREYMKDENVFFEILTNCVKMSLYENHKVVKDIAEALNLYSNNKEFFGNNHFVRDLLCLLKKESKKIHFPMQTQVTTKLNLQGRPIILKPRENSPFIQKANNSHIFHRVVIVSNSFAEINSFSNQSKPRSFKLQDRHKKIKSSFCAKDELYTASKKKVYKDSLSTIGQKSNREYSLVSTPIAMGERNGKLICLDKRGTITEIFPSDEKVEFNVGHLIQHQKIINAIPAYIVDKYRLLSNHGFVVFSQCNRVYFIDNDYQVFSLFRPDDTISSIHLIENGLLVCGTVNGTVHLFFLDPIAENKGKLLNSYKTFHKNIDMISSAMISGNVYLSIKGDENCVSIWSFFKSIYMPISFYVYNTGDFFDCFILDQKNDSLMAVSVTSSGLNYSKIAIDDMEKISSPKSIEVASWRKAITRVNGNIISINDDGYLLISDRVTLKVLRKIFISSHSLCDIKVSKDYMAILDGNGALFILNNDFTLIQKVSLQNQHSIEYAAIFFNVPAKLDFFNENTIVVAHPDGSYSIVSLNEQTGSVVGSTIQNNRLPNWSLLTPSYLISLAANANTCYGAGINTGVMVLISENPALVGTVIHSAENDPIYSLTIQDNYLYIGYSSGKILRKNVNNDSEEHTVRHESAQPIYSMIIHCIDEDNYLLACAIEDVLEIYNVKCTCSELGCCLIFNQKFPNSQILGLHFYSDDEVSCNLLTAGTDSVTRLFEIKFNNDINKYDCKMLKSSSNMIARNDFSVTKSNVKEYSETLICSERVFLLFYGNQQFSIEDFFSGKYNALLACYYKNHTDSFCEHFVIYKSFQQALDAARERLSHFNGIFLQKKNCLKYILPRNTAYIVAIEYGERFFWQMVESSKVNLVASAAIDLSDIVTNDTDASFSEEVHLNGSTSMTVSPFLNHYNPDFERDLGLLSGRKTSNKSFEFISTGDIEEITVNKNKDYINMLFEKTFPQKVFGFLSDIFCFTSDPIYQLDGVEYCFVSSTNVGYRKKEALQVSKIDEFFKIFLRAEKDTSGTYYSAIHLSDILHCLYCFICILRDNTSVFTNQNNTYYYLLERFLKECNKLHLYSMVCDVYNSIENVNHYFIKQSLRQQDITNIKSPQHIDGFLKGDVPESQMDQKSLEIMLVFANAFIRTAKISDGFQLAIAAGKLVRDWSLENEYAIKVWCLIAYALRRKNNSYIAYCWLRNKISYHDPSRLIDENKFYDLDVDMQDALIASSYYCFGKLDSEQKRQCMRWVVSFDDKICSVLRAKEPDKFSYYAMHASLFYQFLISYSQENFTEQQLVEYKNRLINLLSKVKSIQFGHSLSSVNQKASINGQAMIFHIGGDFRRAYVYYDVVIKEGQLSFYFLEACFLRLMLLCRLFVDSYCDLNMAVPQPGYPLDAEIQEQRREILNWILGEDFSPTHDPFYIWKTLQIEKEFDRILNLIKNIDFDLHDDVKKIFDKNLDNDNQGISYVVNNIYTAALFFNDTVSGKNHPIHRMISDDKNVVFARCEAIPSINNVVKTPICNQYKMVQANQSALSPATKQVNNQTDEAKDSADFLSNPGGYFPFSSKKWY